MLSVVVRAVYVDVVAKAHMRFEKREKSVNKQQKWKEVEKKSLC